jgi:hypothetical protein
MSRRLSLCLVALAVFVISPAARAGGPAHDPAQAESSGLGVLSADGSTYYLALAGGGQTTLSAMSARDGSMMEARLSGSWRVPTLTQKGDAGGLSPDGKTLVLSAAAVTSPSRFLIIDAGTLAVTKRVVLKGSFAFDALSPDGSRLYLIQHTSSKDLVHYVVRSYDLRANRLIAGRIADKTQQNWVMSGYATTRATGPGGRWVYTLYKNPGGYPFIHALDTVRGIAHCIGLPWTGDQTKLSNIVLTLGADGKALAVHWNGGRPWLTVNTANWHLTYAPIPPADRRGFPWRWLLIGLPGAVFVTSAFVLVARRSRPRGVRGKASPAPSAS